MINQHNMVVVNVSAFTFRINEINYDLPAGEEVNLNDQTLPNGFYLFCDDARRALTQTSTSLYVGLHSNPPKIQVKLVAAEFNKLPDPEE